MVQGGSGAGETGGQAAAASVCKRPSSRLAVPGWAFKPHPFPLLCGLPSPPCTFIALPGSPTLPPEPHHTQGRLPVPLVLVFLLAQSCDIAVTSHVDVVASVPQVYDVVATSYLDAIASGPPGV